MANKSASDKGGSRRPSSAAKPRPVKAAPRRSASAEKTAAGRGAAEAPVEDERRRSPWFVVLIVLAVLFLICLCVFAVALWYTGDSIIQILLENGLIQ